MKYRKIYTGVLITLAIATYLCALSLIVYWSSLIHWSVGVFVACMWVFAHVYIAIGNEDKRYDEYIKDIKRHEEEEK